MQFCPRKTAVFAAALVFFLVFLANPGVSQRYESLEGLDSIKALFDCRNGDPKSLHSQLQLVFTMYKEKAVRSTDNSPEFAVVFMGESVVALSRNREQFSSQERQILARMDSLLEKMAEAGITLEVCKVAVGGRNVELDSIIPAVEPVPNGWVSSIGYQAQGYSLVPLY